ncbi:glycine cleavage system protein H [Vagococcus sp.]|uniref:glycine cleavage system protein H n=1 Tax=Vagococcus sp. TaxID=1933889 RepID=UPI003F977396
MANENLWTKEEKGKVQVGLTATAQDDLGSIGFVSLPKVGTALEVGSEVIELEAEKTVVEYESPVAGEVIEVNEAALKTPTLLDEPGAWLFTVEKNK